MPIETDDEGADYENLETGQPGTRANISLESSSYRKYDIAQDYQYDSGLVLMPVAGRTAAHRLIRLHGGVGVRKVDFTARRSGKPPIVPSMADVGDDTFLSGGITTHTVQPNPMTGGYDWTVEGSYTYAQGKPRIAGTNTVYASGVPYPTEVDVSASSLAGPYLAAYTTPNEALVLDLENPTNGERIDSFAQAVAGGTVDHITEEYTWPFTFLTPHFTNAFILGG
jgi:hypothetical protein